MDVARSVDRALFDLVERLGNGKCNLAGTCPDPVGFMRGVFFGNPVKYKRICVAHMGRYFCEHANSTE